MAFRLGIDIGGTFTDAILIDEATGGVRIGKVPSTPRDPAMGFMEAVHRMLRVGDLAPADFPPTLFRAKIQHYRPLAVGFNGKRAAREFYGRPVQYGLQSEGIDSTVVFVLPSTSGAARGFWDEAHWVCLVEWLKKIEGS